MKKKKEWMNRFFFIRHDKYCQRHMFIAQIYAVIEPTLNRWDQRDTLLHGCNRTLVRVHIWMSETIAVINCQEYILFRVKVQNKTKKNAILMISSYLYNNQHRHLLYSQITLLFPLTLPSLTLHNFCFEIARIIQQNFAIVEIFVCFIVVKTKWMILREKQSCER